MQYDPTKRFKIISDYAPDDSFTKWKHAAYWTPEEIHQLVMDEIGEDTYFPRGFQVYVKLYAPLNELMDQDPYSLKMPEHEKNNNITQTRIGKILRMGGDAFTDLSRFPSGPLVTYGEYGIWRLGSRDMQVVNGIKVACIDDDRFLSSTTNPVNLKTAFSLETEWANT